MRGNFGKFATLDGGLDHAGMTEQFSGLLKEANDVWCDVVEKNATLTSVELRSGIDKYIAALRIIRRDHAETKGIVEEIETTMRLTEGRLKRLQAALGEVD